VSWTENPLGHDDVVEGLWRAERLGRLPHAMLFEGPPGIGKFGAAVWFARGLYCTEGPGAPCGTCGPCKRILAGTHPDFFLLDPVEEELEIIKVEKIKESEGGRDSIEHFLALRPAEGGKRVVIVREFDRAGIHAQNALLKTLEEPGESALLILETSRVEELLDTVRSRCVKVRFEGLEPEVAKAVLERQGMAPEAAREVLPWSDGSPGRALALVREGAPDLRRAFEAVLVDGADPLEVTIQILALAGEFPGKTPTAQNRARVRSALDLLLAILRDGLRHVSGAPVAGLAHGDLVARMSFSEVAWASALERVLALRGEVELNLPPEGILDRALLALPGVLSTPRASRAADSSRS